MKFHLEAFYLGKKKLFQKSKQAVGTQKHVKLALTLAFKQISNILHFIIYIFFRLQFDFFFLVEFSFRNKNKPKKLSLLFCLLLLFHYVYKKRYYIHLFRARSSCFTLYTNICCFFFVGFKGNTDRLAYIKNKSENLL